MKSSHLNTGHEIVDAQSSGEVAQDVAVPAGKKACQVD
jgi:hypothetical protein